MRMVHGQSFDLSSLLLTTGFALDLGPCFATVVGLALGLSLTLLAAGRRGGSCLASGRRCSHGRTPQKQERRRERQPCPEAMCGGVGKDKITVANGNHALPGRSHRVGVTSDGAENAPRLRVTYGEDSKESQPPLNHGDETHTASAQDNSVPVPWRWRSRSARIRSHIDRPVELNRPRSFWRGLLRT